MTFNHPKMIPKGETISFVPIAITYFSWWVWVFGKDFLVGLPETHPMVVKCTIIGIWSSQLDSGEVERHTESYGY